MNKTQEAKLRKTNSRNQSQKLLADLGDSRNQIAVHKNSLTVAQTAYNEMQKQRDMAVANSKKTFDEAQQNGFNAAGAIKRKDEEVAAAKAEVAKHKALVEAEKKKSMNLEAKLTAKDKELNPGRTTRKCSHRFKNFMMRISGE